MVGVIVVDDVTVTTVGVVIVVPSVVTGVSAVVTGASVVGMIVVAAVGHEGQ